VAEFIDFQTNFRERRAVIHVAGNTSSGDLTLFLGVYNATEYLPDLERQLASQTDEDFRLVVVDNASTDGTWGLVQELAMKLPQDVTVVRNPVNLGFHGSLKLNQDLLQTEWTGFMNQDDVYLSSHVATLNRLSRSATENTVILSTGLGAISPDGERLQTPPRGLWLMSSTPSQLELIIATIAQHVLPEPSIAYRTSALTSIDAPWHSTAFPDTEIALYALTQGSALIDRTETVLYRESPTSASHHLSTELRSLGAALSLTRFLTSTSLAQLEQTLSAAQKEYLTQGVIASLKARFTGTTEFHICALGYLESNILRSNYNDLTSLGYAAEIYSSRLAARAASTLNSAAHFQGGNRLLAPDAHAGPKNHGNTWIPSVSSIYQKMTKFLPRRINHAVGKFSMRLLSMLPRFAAWRFPKEPRQ
jgi:hypothetical protein